MRINKYLSHAGVCSRRDADKLVIEGRVTINNATALPGSIVNERDIVALDGREVTPESETILLAYYKPVGVTCTERDSHADITVIEAINYPKRITYAGRLDKDSEGLLLLSNDGDFINHLMKGQNGHEREYEVEVDIKITPEFITNLSKGVYLKDLDVTTRPCQVAQTSQHSFNIILTQGLNRQIRRMCETFGARVTKLKRIRIENITLRDLKPGQYRELSKEEFISLKTLSQNPPQKAQGR